MMQGRYVISAIDARTYSIIDQWGTQAHLLMVNPLSGPYFNAQIIIAETINARECDYAEFSKEVLSFRFFASDWDQALSIVSETLNELNAGIDVTNPVKIAAMYGGELHGELLTWPSPNITDVH